MNIAKTYWLLNSNVNQPKADYYKTSDKTPYERGMDALDYYRYYGGKPLNIEKTYLNRLLMPIYEDLDLFELKITKKFLQMKDFQDNFNCDETTQALINLTKTVSISVKENIKSKKSLFKDIIPEFKSTKKDTDLILEEGVNKRKMIKPFLQFMEHRELDDQDLMNKTRYNFQNNCERIRKFTENMLIEENLKEIRESEKHDEIFNDYLVEFQKNLESKARRMKIERLKMKINDIQQKLEGEMMQKKEIPKIKRKIVPVGVYKYNDSKNKNNEKDSNDIFGNNSLNDKIFKLMKSENPKTKSVSINQSMSSFSRYIRDKISEEI